jgi:hypothetical protein
MKGITTTLTLSKERVYMKNFISKIFEKANDDDKSFAENIMSIIKQFTTKQPEDYKPVPLMENQIAIVLPDDNVKEPLYYNYLSMNSCRIIENKIDEWVKDYFIYQVKQLHAVMTIHNITYLFLEKNRISYLKYDMFYKHYVRTIAKNEDVFFKNISPILLRELSFKCPLVVP